MSPSKSTIYLLHILPGRCITYTATQVAFTHMRPTRRLEGRLRSHPTTLRVMFTVLGVEVSPEISSSAVIHTLFLSWAVDHVVSCFTCTTSVELPPERGMVTVP